MTTKRRSFSLCSGFPGSLSFFSKMNSNEQLRSGFNSLRLTGNVELSDDRLSLISDIIRRLVRSSRFLFLNPTTLFVSSLPSLTFVFVDSVSVFFFFCYPRQRCPDSLHFSFHCFHSTARSIYKVDTRRNGRGCTRFLFSGSLVACIKYRANHPPSSWQDIYQFMRYRFYKAIHNGNKTVAAERQRENLRALRINTIAKKKFEVKKSVFLFYQNILHTVARIN